MLGAAMLAVARVGPPALALWLSTARWIVADVLMPAVTTMASGDSLPGVRTAGTAHVPTARFVSGPVWALAGSSRRWRPGRWAAGSRSGTGRSSRLRTWRAAHRGGAPLSAPRRPLARISVPGRGRRRRTGAPVLADQAIRLGYAAIVHRAGVRVRHHDHHHGGRQGRPAVDTPQPRPRAPRTTPAITRAVADAAGGRLLGSWPGSVAASRPARLSRRA
jgi:hypothetical protein